MDTLATQLKKAREQKGISLADIADATLINIRFLQEMEGGNFSFLPQTYVRAFLREYALMVGLAPEVVLRSYETALAQVPAAPESSAAPTTPPPVPAPPVQAPPGPGPAIPAGDRRFRSTPALAALIVLVVAALVIALWNMMDRETPAAVKEIPFDQVRAEQERSAARDTAAPAAAPAPPVAAADSLVLSAVATDSVWLQITIDRSPARNLLLKSGGRYTWRAAGRFILTLGNAGAVEFTLNRRALGRLGKPGAVVKNIELSHATLARK